MPIVRVNTSDTRWITRRGISPAAAIGTDMNGVMYFTTDVRVPEVEHLEFASAKVIRFDLGPDAPSDHADRGAMYPASYLVDAEDGEL